jgi:hypothetical protein
MSSLVFASVFLWQGSKETFTVLRGNGKIDPSHWSILMKGRLYREYGSHHLRSFLVHGGGQVYAGNNFGKPGPRRE